MRVMHIADLHLGAEVPLGRSPWEILRLLLRQAANCGADLILIAGDLFHRQPLMRELKEVSRMFEQAVPAEIVFCAGNHDYLRKDSCYRRFEWPENVHFLWKREITALQLEHLPVTVWGSSYWAEQEPEAVYRDLRPDPASDDWQILLAHGGDAKHRPFTLAELERLDFDFAACGHIHKPERSRSGRAVMAGAPQPIDTADYGPHGYWLADLDREVRVEFHPIGGLEYARHEIKLEPGMRRADVLRLAELAAGQPGSGQYAHLVFTGYRDWDLELPLDEVRDLEQVVRAEDQSQPDFDFDEIRETYRGRFIGDFLDALAKEPDQETARLAMRYGMEAIRFASEE